MKNHFLLLLLMLLAGLTATAQAPLERYVEQALQRNIALQREELSLQQSMAALEEAKSQFFPSLQFRARYSVANGGRAFTIPVGDLVNPIYNNLNRLNQAAADASPNFPEIPDYQPISNVQENFLRPTEQETFLRLQMPVFNQAILRNNQMKQELLQASRLSVDIYKKELTKEVKVGYYRYAKAVRGVEILENAQTLLEENLRTSRSLYENHKVTLDAVYGAEAELREVEQQLAAARKNERTAQAYFNFLLNRPYDEAIELSAPDAIPQNPEALEQLRRRALQGRAEFQQLEHYLRAREDAIELQRGKRLPELNLQADYGVQGLGYEFDDEARYFLGSAVLTWTIFDRGRSARVEQARVDKLKLEKQRQETRQQIGLQVVQTYYELEAAAEQVEQAQAARRAAQQAFRLVKKKYEQGQANLVTFTQARTRLTNAEQRLAIARFEQRARAAELERAVGD